MIDRPTVRLPPGARDYLPVAAARRHGLGSAVAQEIERWGYRAIITPLYEYDSVLARGTGARARAMRFVEPSTGEVVALRPDLTPQVARLVATRMHDEPGPLRLYYQGSVVRMSGGHGEELFQIGVELIDAPQPVGDLEVLTLALAALAATGVHDVTVDIGHVAFVRAAFFGLELDEERHAALRLALGKKDAVEVAELTRALPQKRQKLLLALPTLYGHAPDVLKRARKLFDGKAERAAADELELLIARLGELGHGERLSLDLGEARGFDYYTGALFDLYAHGVGGALASGGRYDRLVERYGRPARAAGFALDVDRVAELLKRRSVAAALRSGGLYLAGEPVAAAALAGRLRARGLRAVLDLAENSTAAAASADARLRQRARERALERVLVVTATKLRWFDVDGGARGSLSGTALERLRSDGDAAALDALIPPR